MLNKIHKLEMKTCINKLRNTETMLFNGAHEGGKKLVSEMLPRRHRKERKMPGKKGESTSQKSVLILLLTVFILSSQ